MKEIYLLVERKCGNAEQTRHALYFETLSQAKQYAERFFERETLQTCRFEVETVYSQYGTPKAHLNVIPYVRDERNVKSFWIPFRIESHQLQTKNKGEHNE